MDEINEIREVLNSLHDIHMMALTGKAKHYPAACRFEAIQTQATRASGKLKLLLRSLSETKEHKTQSKEKD